MLHGRRPRQQVSYRPHSIFKKTKAFYVVFFNACVGDALLKLFFFFFKFNKQINTRYHSDACIGTFCEMRMGVLSIRREQVVITEE